MHFFFSSPLNFELTEVLLFHPICNILPFLRLLQHGIWKNLLPILFNLQLSSVDFLQLDDIFHKPEM